MLALLREDEGLGTGRFLCFTCQGLEAEGRAAERLPRVPGDRADSWSWCRGPGMLPFACPWPFLCSWAAAVPDLSLSQSPPPPRSWAAPARGAGPRTGALQSRRSALGTVATQLSQKFIKTLAGGGGIQGCGMTGESSKVKSVRFPETRCYSLPQREMTYKNFTGHQPSDTREDIRTRKTHPDSCVSCKRVNVGLLFLPVPCPLCPQLKQKLKSL